MRGFVLYNFIGKKISYFRAERAFKTEKIWFLLTEHEQRLLTEGRSFKMDTERCRILKNDTRKKLEELLSSNIVRTSPFPPNEVTVTVLGNTLKLDLRDNMEGFLANLNGFYDFLKCDRVYTVVCEEDFDPEVPVENSASN